MSLRYILRPSLTLFLTAAVTIAALSVVHTLTLEPIEKQKQKTREAAMAEVLPGAFEYRQLPEDRYTAPGGNSGSITAVYECLYNGVTAGFVVQLSPAGYGGNIDLLAGISSAGEKLTGMRVLRHSETPGLGALAVKENFYRQYDNRALVPLGVARNSPGVNDINAITSATITSRAITGAVNEAIRWYLEQGRQK